MFASWFPDRTTAELVPLAYPAYPSRTLSPRSHVVHDYYVMFIFWSIYTALVVAMFVAVFSPLRNPLHVVHFVAP